MEISIEYITARPVIGVTAVSSAVGRCWVYMGKFGQDLAKSWLIDWGVDNLFYSIDVGSGNGEWSDGSVYLMDISQSSIELKSDFFLQWILSQDRETWK